MAAYTFSNQSSNCCAAAACSSARILGYMDTAINLAVSIIVSRIGIRLRLRFCA